MIFKIVATLVTATVVSFVAIVGFAFIAWLLTFLQENVVW